MIETKVKVMAPQYIGSHYIFLYYENINAELQQLIMQGIDFWIR